MTFGNEAALLVSPVIESNMNGAAHGQGGVGT